MYELIKLTEKTYYIESPAKVGIVLLGDGEVALIDSGNDKDAGKRILKILAAQNWHLQAIFNTHHHADHVGGNAYLQAGTGCKIYAPAAERGLIEEPLLEPAFLYGGYPPKDLCHKFLMAQPSRVETLTEAVLPAGLTAISLPGHSFGMVGYRTADGVVFLADCLSSEATLAKYGIGFLTDVAAYLETLAAVSEMTAHCFVPAHAAVTADIAPLARINIEKIHQIAACIVTICRVPRTFEEILQKVFESFGLTMTFEQYALVGSAVKSYLTYLKNEGRVTAAFAENRPLWQGI